MNRKELEAFKLKCFFGFFDLIEKLREDKDVESLQQTLNGFVYLGNFHMQDLREPLMHHNHIDLTLHSSGGIQ